MIIPNYETLVAGEHKLTCHTDAVPTTWTCACGKLERHRGRGQRTNTGDRASTAPRTRSTCGDR